MFKRIGIAAAIIAVIIVVAAAVAPYFVGVSAESHFKARITYLNSRYKNKGFILHVDSYHRGFYWSDAEITAITGDYFGTTADITSERKTLQTIFGKGGKLTFHLHINHGPIPFDAFGYGHWNFMPVLYTAEFRGEQFPSDSVLGVLNPNVYVVQYFTGNSKVRLTIPPGRIAKHDVTAKWQGGHLTANLNYALDHAHYTGKIMPLNLQFNDRKSRHTYDTNIVGWNFSGKEHKAKYGFWVGPGKATFGGLTVKKDGKEIVKFAPGRVHGTITQTGNGRWLNEDGHLQQSGGHIFGWSWSHLTLDGMFSHLDAIAIRQTQDQLRAAARAAEQKGKRRFDQQSEKAIWSNFYKAFAPAQMSYRFAIASSGGTLNVATKAHFNGSVPASAPTATSLGMAFQIFSRADLDTKIDFDRKFANGLGMAVKAPSVQSVGQALQLAQRRGYLKQSTDGRYHTEIVWRGGHLTINGRSIKVPVPAAQSAPSAATAG